MTSRSKAEIRRCRPLLGTFVEITASCDEAVEAAFVVIERIQQLMSFHDAGSEISRMNRRVGNPQPVTVSRETYEVLACSKKLHAATGGVFDIAIAPELMSWGLLPGRPAHRTHGHTSDIALLPGRRVQFLRTLQIDLGGIAKGYAVDKAVEALRANGATSGLVNAGGDLRCFGNRPRQVWVRHPRTSGAMLRLPALRDAALATSANSSQRHRRQGRMVCAHVDGRSRRPLLRSYSVSVLAPSCLVADALTKVVLALGESAAPLLAQFDARAFIARAAERKSCHREDSA